MDIDRVSWEDFTKSFQWKQGEHLAGIAPTGAGKTTLFLALMPIRKYSLFFGTKPDDPLYRELIRKHGFRRVESVREIKPYEDRILLWPKQRATIPETYAAQRKAFAEAFDMVVKQRAWTVWVDECKYMAEQLGLTRALTYCLEQLRSINGTIISGAQRPVWLPRSVLINSSHVFLWRTNDREDAKRLSDIGGIDSRVVANVAKTLDPHEFIYIKTRGTETEMVRSQVRK